VVSRLNQRNREQRPAKHFVDVCRRTLVLHALALPFVAVCGSSDGTIADDAVRVEYEFGREVESLGGYANLEVDFSWSEISDDDLARMRVPDTVRSVSLANTRITDKGLSALTDLSNLEQINLMNTDVTDEGLEHLKESPRLWQVHLAGSKVSQEGTLDMTRFLAPRASEYHERAARRAAKRRQEQ